MTDSRTHDIVFEMAKGRSLRLADASAYEIFCLEGSLAMTRSDNAHASVLADGESYRFDGSSVLMLRALADSRVRMVYAVLPATQQSSDPRTTSGWAERWARLRQ